MVVDVRQLALPSRVVARAVAGHQEAVVKGRVEFSHFHLFFNTTLLVTDTDFLCFLRIVTDANSPQHLVPLLSAFGLHIVEPAPNQFLVQVAYSVLLTLHRHGQSHQNFLRPIVYLYLRIQLPLLLVSLCATVTIHLHGKAHAVRIATADPTGVLTPSREHTCGLVLVDFPAEEASANLGHNVFCQAVTHVQEQELPFGAVGWIAQAVKRSMMSWSQFHADSVALQAHAIIIRCSQLVALGRVMPLFFGIKTRLWRK